MDALTLFGFASVTAMLLCYAFESRGRTMTLLFAWSCAASSLYGFLQGAWPIGVVEAIWAVVALNKWRLLGSWRGPDPSRIPPTIDGPKVRR